MAWCGFMLETLRDDDELRPSLRLLQRPPPGSVRGDAPTRSAGVAYPARRPDGVAAFLRPAVEVFSAQPSSATAPAGPGSRTRGLAAPVGHATLATDAHLHAARAQPAVAIADQPAPAPRPGEHLEFHVRAWPRRGPHQQHRALLSGLRRPPLPLKLPSLEQTFDQISCRAPLASRTRRLDVPARVRP
jgi:hypothetical protein